MHEYEQKFFKYSPRQISFALSVVLIVSGFLIPPTGVIDGSVLTAVGELLVFSVVARIPEAMKSGRSIKVQKGDSSVEISGEHDHISV